jgi:hypothetical protein
MFCLIYLGFCLFISLVLIVSVVLCLGNTVMGAKMCTDCQYAFDEGMLRVYVGDCLIHRNKLIFKHVAVKCKYKFCKHDLLINFTLIVII